MSFHDLLYFDSSTGYTGAQGCIIDSRAVANFDQNNGLISFGIDLKSFVLVQFPKIKFSSGDIVSLAGKVAAENAFPCIKIKWSFGRKPCTGKDGPGPNINTLRQMKPFLRRYGLSALEMATLTVGAHGVAGSVNTHGIDLQGHQAAYGNASSPSYLGRLPSDMLFFPSALLRIGGAVVDPSSEIARVEESLLSYNQASFNKAFGEVYAKMLLIETNDANLTPFS